MMHLISCKNCNLIVLSSIYVIFLFHIILTAQASEPLRPFDECLAVIKNEAHHPSWLDFQGDLIPLNFNYTRSEDTVSLIEIYSNYYQELLNSAHTQELLIPLRRDRVQVFETIELIFLFDQAKESIKQLFQKFSYLYILGLKTVPLPSMRQKIKTDIAFLDQYKILFPRKMNEEQLNNLADWTLITLELWSEINKDISISVLTAAFFIEPLKDYSLNQFIENRRESILNDKLNSLSDKDMYRILKFILPLYNQAITNTHVKSYMIGNSKTKFYSLITQFVLQTFLDLKKNNKTTDKTSLTQSDMAQIIRNHFSQILPTDLITAKNLSNLVIETHLPKFRSDPFSAPLLYEKLKGRTRSITKELDASFKQKEKEKFTSQEIKPSTPEVQENTHMVSTDGKSGFSLNDIVSSFNPTTTPPIEGEGSGQKTLNTQLHTNSLTFPFLRERRRKLNTYTLPLQKTKNHHNKRKYFITTTKSFRDQCFNISSEMIRFIRNQPFFEQLQLNPQSLGAFKDPQIPKPFKVLKFSMNGKDYRLAFYINNSVDRPHVELIYVGHRSDFYKRAGRFLKGKKKN